MALTGLAVLDQGQPTPDGWTKIDRDLNSGAHGDFLYFAYELDGTKHPITDIVFVLDGAPAPEGYVKIDTDLNKGTPTHHHSIYACYTRKEGTPIQSLDVVLSDVSSIKPPVPWTYDPTDLNTGARGQFVYLCRLL
ncbi:hypothetical protein AB0D49_40595 [Streptomyces sp. NPDC048290]|uniref:hypothetical protein n=1 Tax=Streptomyces sp. NPDC048290 TaxID=3155811 RepID=UPI00341835FB